MINSQEIKTLNDDTEVVINDVGNEYIFDNNDHFKWREPEANYDLEPVKLVEPVKPVKPLEPVRNHQPVTNIYLSNRQKTNKKRETAKGKKTVKLKKKETNSTNGYKAPKKRKSETRYYAGRYPPRWEEYSLWTNHKLKCKHENLCTYFSGYGYTFDVCKKCKLPYNFSNDPYNPKNNYDSDW